MVSRALHPEDSVGAGGGLQDWVFFHLQSTLKVPFRAEGRQLLAAFSADQWWNRFVPTHPPLDSPATTTSVCRSLASPHRPPPRETLLSPLPRLCSWGLGRTQPAKDGLSAVPQLLSHSATPRNPARHHGRRGQSAMVCQSAAGLPQWFSTTCSAPGGTSQCLETFLTAPTGLGWGWGWGSYWHLRGKHLTAPATENCPAQNVRVPRLRNSDVAQEHLSPEKPTKAPET